MINANDGLELLATSADLLAAHVACADDFANLPRTTMQLPSVVAAIVDRTSLLTGLSRDTVIARVIALATARLEQTPDEIHELADAISSEDNDRNEVMFSVTRSFADALDEECADHPHDGGAFLSAMMVALIACLGARERQPL